MSKKSWWLKLKLTAILVLFITEIVNIVVLNI